MISVIIAAFNAAATIDRCISSIDVAKKSHEIELIVIDDGSKDETARLLHSWESAKVWITVKYQRNSGVADARNTGLDIATGNYIVFIDADDSIDDWYFDFVVEQAVDRDIEMLAFGHKRIMLNGDVIERHNISAEYSRQDIESLQLRVTENRNIYWYVTTKVYSKSLIADLRFNCDVKLGEDGIFNIECLDKASHLSVVPDCPYNYYENATSMTSLRYKPGLLESIEADYKARIKIHDWSISATEKQVLLSDFARSYIEHMLPYLLNNLAHIEVWKRRTELMRIRQSFVYQNCLPHYYQQHPSRGIRILISCFSRHWYVMTLVFLQLSWTKAKVKRHV
ncbi:glycosyltransferase family 2 protein [Psychrobacter sp. NG25]|uniref:glycosyltransferase family 2 protein n=1 Tax=Psychrobacter sp. NG25 TaxID=2782005 RepID=UPI001883BACF|nr:glycosyltransferase family A protein [Psychrobacter sp. NG25]MBF0658237.1 glycosyltransferase family 2 protein [Psychrobacter sp. NG25]